MAEFKTHKFVAALPTQLEADALYFVRAGSGFDLYVTNHSGTIVASKLNTVPIDSPAFTGVPTAPTATNYGDLTDQVATLGFVQNYFALYGMPILYTTFPQFGDMYAIHSENANILRPRGLSFYCQGKPGASEVIASGIVPYDNGLPISGTGSRVSATVAATGTAVFSIKRTGTQIGTITFSPGATLGVVSIDAGAGAAKNTLVTVTAPATPDATLADITGLLSEAR